MQTISRKYGKSLLIMENQYFYLPNWQRFNFVTQICILLSVLRRRTQNSITVLKVIPIIDIMYLKMFQNIYDEDYLDFYDPKKCIGDLGEKWCNFKWRIYNLHLNPAGTLHSPVFTTRLFPNTHWYLEVRLSSPGDLRTMDISLNRLQNYKSSIKIVDVIYKLICDEEVQTSDKHKIEYDNDCLADGRAIFRANFYKPKKNYLTVECKLRPNQRMIQAVCHRNLDEDLPINLRLLLQTGEFHDTIIRVGNYRLIAHIAILHARLPQLLEKCQAPSKEGEKYIVNINDLPLSVVKEMLKYAYTGQAYVDTELFAIGKDIYASYSRNFFQSCCWEDHPFATTIFNYETDSLSWHLKDVFEKSHLGFQSIELLRFFSSRFIFSLDVDVSEKGEKWLMLTFQFLSEEIAKPTIVSCNSFLVNRESNVTIELGETVTLWRFDLIKGKLKLCSLLEVKEGGETIRATDNFLILQTDFKFCYGSSKSSIENLYEGQFDLSKCTSCPQLSADMEALFKSIHYHNIILESGDRKKIRVHKAILLARWPAADRGDLKDQEHVIMPEHGYEALRNFLLQLYKGFGGCKCDACQFNHLVIDL